MSKKSNNKKNQKLWLTIISLIIVAMASYFGIDLDAYDSFNDEYYQEALSSQVMPYYSADLSDIPEYSGEPYVYLNNNIPEFTQSELELSTFESYSELDYLGRCGVAFAKIGEETMPTGERESIGSVKPSGWQTLKFDSVDGKYLYNRCHLIGYQLSAENANEKNLITGTRYMNVTGMLPFENKVAEYVKESQNHVLYRVTPMFENENLVATGVKMEAQSIEDDGYAVRFNVFVYNVQPGIEIDYQTGNAKINE